MHHSSNDVRPTCRTSCRQTQSDAGAQEHGTDHTCHEFLVGKQMQVGRHNALQYSRGKREHHNSVDGLGTETPSQHLQCHDKQHSIERKEGVLHGYARAPIHNRSHTDDAARSDFVGQQERMIAESDENPCRELENLKMMEQFMVDGLIVSLCSYRKNIEMYQQLEETGMAVVFYDRIPYGMDVSQVLVEDNVDSYFMVEHLIRLGRMRIAYIQGPDDIYNAYQRGLGYREAMEKFRLYDPSLIVKTGMTFKDGADAIDRLIYNKVDFDSVFAFTDTLAIGAQNRLRALGKRVPEDIFVASFSGTELSTIVSPRITTMEPPLEEMGRKAAELVMEKINNPETENKMIVLKTTMRCRESTGE